MVTHWELDVIIRLKVILNHLVQHNKQYHMKVLLNGFHLNGHTLEFYSQTSKPKPPCAA